MPNFEPKYYVGRARIRARDIREAFQGRNIDPAITQTFEALAEQDSIHRQMIDQLADLLNQAIDNVIQLQDVMSVQKGMLEKMDTKRIATDAIRLMDGDEVSGS